MGAFGSGSLKRRVRKYDAARYLGKAHDDLLIDREADLELNLWEVGEGGEVVALRDLERRRWLLERLVDVQREQQLRRQRVELGVDEAQVIRRATDSYHPPQLDRPVHLPAGGLVRYGERAYIEQALGGSFRISPAATYKDPSLNSAQKDDELQQHVVTPHEKLNVTFYASDELGGEVRAIEPEAKELFRLMLLRNFYVMCCCTRFDLRMFRAFNYDAALVISDRRAFVERINKAVLAAVEASGRWRAVSYHDPYSEDRSALVPGFSKHFKYSYQNEFRLLWHPSKPGPMEPLHVEAGDMRDIAEMVVLRTG